MLKLTEHVGITIYLLYKQKTRWNSDIQNLNNPTPANEALCGKINFELWAKM